MQRSIDLRLRKLEATGTDEIPIWCDEANDVPSTIDQMIAEGELLEADRARCVHWTVARIVGGHERALAALQAEETENFIFRALVTPHEGRE
jgi:hypothetical protein